MHVQKLTYFSELLSLLVKKEMKVRYKNSLLGYFWAILNPVSFAIVYFVAFKIVLRMHVPNYSTFLLVGMFPWVWFTNSLTRSATSFVNNSTLVKKVNTSKVVLPVSNVAHEMFHFVLALPVLGLFIFITGGQIFAAWLWQIPLMLAIQAALTIPLAIIFAFTNTYIRDIEYILGIFLSLLFYVTPIIYPISMVPEKYLLFFGLNPMVDLINNWRLLFMEGRLDFHGFFYLGAMIFFLYLLCFYIYKKMSRRVGEVL